MSDVRNNHSTESEPGTDPESCPFEDIKGYKEDFADNDGENRHPTVRNTLLKTAFDVSNTMVGVGILSTPLVVKTLGILPGLFVTGIIMLLTHDSTHYLMRAKELSQRYSYALMSRLTMGVWGMVFTKFILFADGFLVTCIYFKILGDILRTLLLMNFADGGEFYYKTWFLSVCTAVLLLPLVFKKDISGIYKFTFLGMFSLYFLAFALVVNIGYKYFRKELEPLSLQMLFPKVVSFKPICVACFSLLNDFTYQTAAFPIYLPLLNRSSKEMKRAVDLGSLFTALIVNGMGIFGFICYRDKIVDSVLICLRDDIISYKTTCPLMAYFLMFAQVAYYCKACVSMGIYNFTSKKNITMIYVLVRDNLFPQKKTKKEDDTELKNVDEEKFENTKEVMVEKNKEMQTISESTILSITLLTYVIALLISISSDRIIDLEEVLSAFVCTYLVLTGPALIYYLLARRIKGLFMEKGWAIFIVILGLLNLVVFFYNRFI